VTARIHQRKRRGPGGAQDLVVGPAEASIVGIGVQVHLGIALAHQGRRSIARGVVDHVDLEVHVTLSKEGVEAGGQLVSRLVAHDDRHASAGR
jgi:hypothetical protein